MTTAVSSQLDHSRFDEAVELIALQIPKKLCTLMLKRLGGHIYHKPKVKPVVTVDDNPEARRLLLSEEVRGLGLEGLPEALRAYVLAEGAEPVHHTLHLGYEHLDAAQAMRRVLPSDIGDVPSSFEQVGHVAHVNLRDEHLPYKHLIGQVLLEKNAPRIRSVVNKLESISNYADEKSWRFRVFPMEVLAGSEDLKTSVRENGASFHLDYRDVYWNSRLETEHKRILDLLPSGAVVADAFAGIGPFAVPAALKGCNVYANDLNPKSFEWLNVNVAANKVDKKVKTFNLDGRQFVHALLGFDGIGCGDGSTSGGSGCAENDAEVIASTGEMPGQRSGGSARDAHVPTPEAPEGSALAHDLASIAGSAAASAAAPSTMQAQRETSAAVVAPGASAPKRERPPFGCFSHVLMNLPASALTFLDAFAGSFDPVTWTAPLPMVHCYCFSKAKDPAAEVIGIAEKALGCPLPDATVTTVRDVSPHKLMLCLEFQVPEAVAWRNATPSEDRGKRQRTMPA